MKKTILLFSLLLILNACSSEKEQVFLFSYFMGNGATGMYLASSHNGLEWKALNDAKPILAPAVGKDSLMRDPCIIQGPDGTFHMVWTTGWWDRYIGYASSKDLVHWSEQKTIPVMMHEEEAKNSWAPELFYDKEHDRFLIFWATTIPDRHSPVAESEREKGLNHRIYVTSTKDFETFEPASMFFNPEFSVIDATLLEKEDQFIMFLKNENPNPPEKNIRITRSENAAGPYSLEVSDPITGAYWAEGPTTLQLGEYVYVYFDKYRNHRYGAVRSKDLENWEDISDSIIFPDGIRHGTAFKIDVDVYEHLLEQLN